MKDTWPAAAAPRARACSRAHVTTCHAHITRPGRGVHERQTATRSDTHETPRKNDTHNLTYRVFLKQKLPYKRRDDRQAASKMHLAHGIQTDSSENKLASVTKRPVAAVCLAIEAGWERNREMSLSTRNPPGRSTDGSSFFSQSGGGQVDSEGGVGGSSTLLPAYIWPSFLKPPCAAAAGGRPIERSKSGNSDRALLMTTSASDSDRTKCVWHHTRRHGGR